MQHGVAVQGDATCEQDVDIGRDDEEEREVSKASDRDEDAERHQQRGIEFDDRVVHVESVSLGGLAEEPANQTDAGDRDHAGENAHDDANRFERNDRAFLDFPIGGGLTSSLLFHLRGQ